MEWVDEDFTPRVLAMRNDQARMVGDTDANRRLLATALELARTSKHPLVAAPFASATARPRFA
jgi:hypothetical protein